jgi:hypothetical protein
LILFAAILMQLLSFWWIIWCHFALLILVPKREEEGKKLFRTLRSLGLWTGKNH